MWAEKELGSLRFQTVQWSVRRVCLHSWLQLGQCSSLGYAFHYKGAINACGMLQDLAMILLLFFHPRCHLTYYLRVKLEEKHEKSGLTKSRKDASVLFVQEVYFIHEPTVRAKKDE